MKTEKEKTIKTTKSIQGWIPLLIFCATAGLLATLWGYNYMDGNAEEQLPFIFRAINPNYLLNDFFTNTFNQYGPRTFFSEFIAFFANLLSIPAVLFLLTTLANIAIAFLSSLVAKHFFTRSMISQLIAAASVLTLKTFWLGYSNIVYRNFLEPEHLAMPLLILGFLFILKKKPILAGFSFGLSAFFHALLGLEIGWILLGMALLDALIRYIRKEPQTIIFLKLLLGCLVLAGFSAGLLLPYMKQPSIPANEFIHLVAFFRHPHHYLPSTFEMWQWGQAAVYLLGVVFVFGFTLKISESLKEKKRYLLLITGLIVLLCLGGYLFVEIWPSRLWTSAQMFRLPYFLKWFSLILLAGWAGSKIEEIASTKQVWLGAAAAISLVTPASMAFLPIAVWARKKLLDKIKLPAWIVSNLVLLLITLAILIVYKPEMRTWALYLLLVIFVSVTFFVRWKPLVFAAGNTLLLGLSVLFFLFGTVMTPPSFIKYDAPVFSLYKTTGELAEVASYARENTPSDAVYLIPPNLGEFRYMADRAIVVDFVAYPFQDFAMQEWYARMTACYGVAEKSGFDALYQMNQSVYHYTDQEILALSDRFGFDYAVVYDSTETNYPIIFRTTTYKLIEIIR